MTEHYVIMAHWPSTIKPLKLVASARLMEALAWEPANGVRFRVFARKRGGRRLVATFRYAQRLEHMLQQLTILSGVCRQNTSAICAARTCLC